MVIPAPKSGKVDKMLVEADEALAAGEYPLGLAISDAVLREDPKNLRGMYMRGANLLGLNNFPEARKQLGRVLKQAPDYVGALHAIARAGMSEGKHAEAKKHLQRAIRIEPSNPVLILSMCNLLAATNQHAEALDLVEKAISEGVDRYPLANERADLLSRLGRQEEAIAILLEAVESGELWENLEAMCYHTLGKLYEKVGEYEKAFDSWTIGNRAKKVFFDVEKFEKSQRQLMRLWDRDTIDELRRTDGSSEVAVFIVGMPRSGTSLAEQITSCHPLVHGAGELSEVAFYCHKLQGGFNTCGITLLPEPEHIDREELDKYARSFLDLLKRSAKRVRRITDKMPTNFLYLGMIEAMFPNARIIHCVRDPMDTCVSCYSQSFSGLGNAFAYDQSDLGRFYRHYAELMEHWKRETTLRWLDFTYEEVVADQEGQSRRLIDFLGLDWDPACLDFHKSDRVTLTASREQVRKKIYTSSLGRAERFGSLFDPLKKAIDGDGEARAD